MNPIDDYIRNETRRQFFAGGERRSAPLRWLSLLGHANGRALGRRPDRRGHAGPHFARKAKHVIYLHMVGGPSQMDLFDYKPVMREWYDKDLPESIRMGQRLTTMTSGQTRFPIAPSKFKFAQHGQCGMWVTELLPYTAKMVDDMCFIRSMHTEAINHEPAISYMQTGNQITGRPCLGSWVSYGLGSLNENLPTFVVLVASRPITEQVQAISARLWSRGYLSGEHAGVSFRSRRRSDPVSSTTRRRVRGKSAAARSTASSELNEMNYQQRRRPGDAHAHPAVRNGLPHAGERAGADGHRRANRQRPISSTARRRRSPAPSPTPRCWRGGWSSAACASCRFTTTTGTRTPTSPAACPASARTSTRPCYGLIQDLKQRGMLDETLVIWGGEFGRTIYSQGGLTHGQLRPRPSPALLHHVDGRRRHQAAGTIYGETDDFSYNIVKDPVHIRDFHATILHLLGFDHERFTFRYQGLDQRLTGVEPARVVKEILA